jgi:hypothetical protein
VPKVNDFRSQISESYLGAFIFGIFLCFQSFAKDKTLIKIIIKIKNNNKHYSKAFYKIYKSKRKNMQTFKLL